MRTRALVGALFLAFAVMPAHARSDHTCLDQNGGLWGWIMCTTYDPLVPAADPPTQGGIAAQCAFEATLTPDNRMTVVFGGTASSTGPTGNAVPLVTSLTCEVRNGEQSADATLMLNGPAVAVAEVAIGWHVADVTVCVHALSVTGPTPVVVREIEQSCSTRNVREMAAAGAGIEVGS